MLWKQQIPIWVTLWGLICFGVTVIYFLTKLHDTWQFPILNNSTEHECEYRWLLWRTQAEYQCPDSGRIIRCHSPACWISKCPVQRKRADWHGWRGHSEGSNNEQKSVCWCFSKWKSQSVTNRQPCVFWSRTPSERELKRSFFLFSTRRKQDIGHTWHPHRPGNSTHWTSPSKTTSISLH